MQMQFHANIQFIFKTWLQIAQRRVMIVTLMAKIAQNRKDGGSPMQARSLWLAVISLCAQDYREKRLRWAYFFTDDFLRICEYAHVNPQQTRNTMRPNA